MIVSKHTNLGYHSTTTTTILLSLQLITCFIVLWHKEALQPRQLHGMQDQPEPTDALFSSAAAQIVLWHKEALQSHINWSTTGLNRYISKSTVSLHSFLKLGVLANWIYNDLAHELWGQQHLTCNSRRSRHNITVWTSTWLVTFQCRRTPVEYTTHGHVSTTPHIGS